MEDASDDRLDISAETVSALIAAQAPHWAGRKIRPVRPGGWDNRTFRLGADLVVRLPSAARYAAQPAREHRWLPHLAPQLPLDIPCPLLLGRPGAGYPYCWSIRRWIDGTPLPAAGRSDPAIGRALAAFLRALWQIDAANGPKPSAENHHRGGSLSAYEEEALEAIDGLGRRINGAAARALWMRARASAAPARPVWVHGDMAAGNLLLREGTPVAVIDFGLCAVGDPACDLTVAWTALSDPARSAFRDALAADSGTWARARGWALWKAAITLVRGEDPVQARVLATVLEEERQMP